MTLTHLIERCESGSGPDRELDALVCAAIRYVPRPRYQYISELRYEALDDGSIEAFLTTGDERKVERFPSLTLTSSLDAVVSLIEQNLPGWHWQAKFCGGAPEASDGWVFRPGHAGEEQHSASALTPARALLAAFLKAYANKEGVSDGR